MALPDAHGITLIGRTDLGGHGDCMHVNVYGDFAFVGHMGGDRIGTSVVDVSDPAAPRVVAQLTTPPGIRSHKVQVVDDLLLVNYERNPQEPGVVGHPGGLKIFDVADPTRPVERGFLETPGKGVHRLTYWEPPLVYMSGSDDGFTDQFLIIVDVSDPSAPVEVGRWWAPGMKNGETATWPPHRRHAMHHAVVDGPHAFVTWWDGGLYILDVADPATPRELSHLTFPAEESSATHTAFPLPGRDLLVVTDEAIAEPSQEPQKQIRVVDISDVTSPRVVSTMPVPVGDFAERGGRFGPHNLHEMRPGSFQSSSIVHATYFNAGIRIYDVSNQFEPKEIAHYVPEDPAPGVRIQMNDLTVDPQGRIYATDRMGGGLYIFEVGEGLY